MHLNRQAPATFNLNRDAWGRLVLTAAEGRQFVGIDVVRAFPISDPSHCVSLCDAEGDEILWIDDLQDIPAVLRQTLEEELARRHFLPQILRVMKIEGLAEPTTWEVETDRGCTKFQLKSEEDVRRWGGDRVLIVDSHAVRYLIPSVQDLDAASRRFLGRYI
jgi:Domain of unknown function (DUF1854)